MPKVSNAPRSAIAMSDRPASLHGPVIVFPPPDSANSAPSCYCAGSRVEGTADAGIRLPVSADTVVWSSAPGAPPRTLRLDRKRFMRLVVFDGAPEHEFRVRLQHVMRKRAGPRGGGAAPPLRRSPLPTASRVCLACCAGLPLVQRSRSAGPRTCALRCWRTLRASLRARWSSCTGRPVCGWRPTRRARAGCAN